MSPLAYSECFTFLQQANKEAPQMILDSKSWITNVYVSLTLRTCTKFAQNTFKISVLIFFLKHRTF